MKNPADILSPSELKFCIRRAQLCKEDIEYGVMQTVLEKACADVHSHLYGAPILCIYPDDCFGIRVKEHNGKWVYVSTNDLQFEIIKMIPKTKKTEAVNFLVEKVKIELAA